MNAMQTEPLERETAEFRHEALFYQGDEGFVHGVTPFIRDGVHRDEPVLVVVLEPKVDLLRAELDGDGAGVVFADMAQLGRNPGRIIPAWRDFLDGDSCRGRRVRGVGEPIWAGRSAAELVESQRHEALLNVAFAGSGGWRLMCPYDTGALPAPVIEEAARSHAYIADSAGERPSPDFNGELMPTSHLSDDLPEPARCLEDFVVSMDELRRLRAVVAARAAQFGMDLHRTEDLMLAVHEIAANSVSHGGGTGGFRLWREAQSLVCELRDRGSIAAPLAGRERPPIDGDAGRGLWLANQLCDLVQIRSFPRGAVVRLHMSLADR